MNPFLLVILAYLVGATPTGLWVGKRLYGVDLRTVGSGNLGATNTFRVLGWKAAVPVMLVDVLKGWLPTWLFPSLDYESSAWGWALAYGAAAILGHVYSVWVLTVSVTRIVSLGSVLAALSLPILIALTPHEGGGALTWFSVALSIFVIAAHRANLARLARGEEHRFGRARGATGRG